MDRIFATFFVFLSLFPCIDIKSQGKNYINYHEKVNYIEHEYYVKGNLKSIEEYKTLFERYDYIFLRDCLMALQLSIKNNTQNLSTYFFRKSLENGLRPSNFKFIPLLNEFLKTFNIEELKNICMVSREKYLARIDTSALKEMMDIYANDQCVKNGLRSLSKEENENNYRIEIANTIHKLKNFISKYGIPSDKLIGIDQNSILTELKLNKKDILFYYYNYKDLYFIQPSQFVFEENCFGSTMLLPLMWHYKCSFNYFKEVFLSGIRSGYIHPRDVACIKDQDFDNTYHPCVEKSDSVYCMVLSGNNRYINMPDSVIDKNRKNLHIVSLETDRKKRIYCKNNGIRFEFGFLGIR